MLGLSFATACTEFEFEREVRAGAGPIAGGSAGGGATGGDGTGGSAAGTGGSGAAPTRWEDLARTPPMGWNSWNRFSGGVSESIVQQIATAIVSSGMKDAGYQYVIVDDTWQANARDADGNIVADSARFPSGIQALAEHVHGLGLSFGLYSDRGTKTCAGRPGSFGYEERDAETYAAWGVDYLKYDNCYIPSGRDNSLAMEEDYRKMRTALQVAGRPIVYSICAWWFHDWMPDVGHLWRTTTDIRDGWEDNLVVLLDRNGGYVGRYQNAVYGEPGIAHHAGPGGWNDPDMLEVGNGGMSDIEYRSHFNLWAIMAAPLIAGNDVRTMSAATREILLNTEVIAVDQDTLGQQGVPISQSTELEVWRRPLASGAQAVVLLNRGETPSDISVSWQSLGISGPARVRDLWLHADLGTVTDQYTAAAIPPHGSVMVIITPE